MGYIFGLRVNAPLAMFSTCDNKN